MGYDFSAGFQTSTTETIIFASILALIVIVLIVGRLVRPKPKPKKLPPNVRRRVDVGKERVELNEKDQYIVRRLAWVLKNPRNMNQLLDDHALFRRAAHKAIREGIVSEQEILQFTRRLDIDSTGLTASVHSTRSIVKGATISISDGETAVIHGDLEGMDETSLHINLQRNARGFPSGTTVEVVAVGPNGMHRFRSRILRHEKKEIRLVHIDQVNFTQRRKFRRRRTEVPVDISPAGMSDIMKKTKTEDISVGGAALINPRKQFNTGDRVTCSFHIGKSRIVESVAVVVRTSRRNKLLHVQFSQLDEKSQFNIFRFVYTAGKSK